jgi:hypothetical protein
MREVKLPAFSRLPVLLDVTLSGMDEFPVEDEQREAALAHLASEHAHGALDAAELDRRTTDVRAARTVAELLTATADPAIARLSAPSPDTHRNGVALVIGMVAAVVLLVLVAYQVL